MSEMEIMSPEWEHTQADRWRQYMREYSSDAGSQDMTDEEIREWASDQIMTCDEVGAYEGIDKHMEAWARDMYDGLEDGE